MQTISLTIALFIILEVLIMYLFYIYFGDLIEEKFKKFYKRDFEHKEIFLTKCSHCDRKIAILTNKDRFIHGLFTCNNCVPKDSCCRNNIDESKETDLFDEIDIDEEF